MLWLAVAVIYVTLGMCDSSLTTNRLERDAYDTLFELNRSDFTLLRGWITMVLTWPVGIFFPKFSVLRYLFLRNYPRWPN